MLESVKCAYDKGAFNDEDIKCPYDLKKIETFHQILAPAYRVSLGFQKKSTSITEVVPYILNLIEIWNKLDLPPVPKRFCELLTACLRNKFNFELNSTTYQVRITVYYLNFMFEISCI